MKALIPLFALLALPALAQTRPATRAEADSFAAFHKNGQPAVVVATRAGRGWALSATVDSAARRGSGTLCRLVRARFDYDSAAKRWNPGPDTHFAWLGKCEDSARAVMLRQRIPDAELQPLLDQHGALLVHARLLMAGNTSCAPVRSYRLRLVGIDVSAPPAGTEELHALLFESDRETRATVWVKKTRSGLDAWSVACSAYSDSMR